MPVSRREALSLSGSTLAGPSFVGLLDADLQAQAQNPAEPWPDRLVERPQRQGFPAPLPLNADGSAPEHPASAAGPISDPLMWRTANRQAPEIEFDYLKMAIKVDTRGLAKLGGTLHFADLERLPRVTHTFLLQCGAPNPKGSSSGRASRSRPSPTCWNSCPVRTTADSSRRIVTRRSPRLCSARRVCP